jgi:hypothetical protein
MSKKNKENPLSPCMSENDVFGQPFSDDKFAFGVAYSVLEQSVLHQIDHHIYEKEVNRKKKAYACRHTAGLLYDT